jgi:hypothetical protein
MSEYLTCCCGRHLAFPLQDLSVWPDDDARLENARRIAGREAARRNVLHHNTARCNNRPVADTDTWENNGVGANEATFTYPRIKVHIVEIIVSQNRCAKCDGGISADMNPTRITFVQSGFVRNYTIFTDIHSPHCIEIPTADAS